MKILHVNTIDTGGAAIAAIRLHLLLLEKGLDSRILFLRRQSKKHIPHSAYLEDLYSPFTFKIIDKANKIYNRLGTLTHPDIYFNGPKSLFRLQKHPWFEEADIIHLHWVVKLIDWSTLFTNSKKKFAWTFHDMNPFTGGEHYRTGYSNEFSNQSFKNIHIKKRAILNTSIRGIGPSEWICKEARQSDVWENKQVECIRNPVSPDTFYPQDKSECKKKFGFSSEKKSLVFVAENPDDKRKGLDYLLKSCNELVHTGIDVQVVGNPSKLGEVPEYIKFTGRIDDENEMAQLYNAADLFVIPSLEDNLPNTVSEALLCGTPVCGFSIGGIREMIVDGENGYCSPRLTELSSTLEKCLTTHFDPKKIREGAMTTLNPDYLFNSFQSFYNRLLSDLD